MRLSATKNGAISTGRGLGNELWDKAGTAPSLDLQFADNKSLVDATTGSNLVTFTRASSGTFVDSAGVLQTAATDAPRFDHNPTTGESLGLLVEEQRTNLLLRSEEFDNASWVKARTSVSFNATTAPNGTATADALIEDTTASASHIAYQNVNVGVAFYTISVYAKASTRTQFYLRIDTATQSRVVIFDLTTGTSTNSSGIVGSVTLAGNGWYRCTATLTAAENCINAVIGLALAGNVSYTGDGTSGIYVWGAQLEAGAFPTSYIPTTTAAVTRNADVASITGSAYSSWFTSANENTFYVEGIKTQANVANGTFFCGSNNTVNAIVGGWITYNSTGSKPRFQSRQGSVRGDTQNNAADLSAGSVFKGALCTSTDTFAAVSNGSLVTSAATPVQTDWGTSLAIGWFPSGGYTGALNGHIRRLTYWPQRLANATLQTLTQ